MNIIKYIETVFIRVIENRVSIPVIRSYAAGPEPVSDYCVISVDVLEEQRSPETHYSVTGQDLSEVTRETYNGLIQIRFYGDNAYENAFQVRGDMNRRTTSQDMFTNNAISLQTVGTLRRSDEIRETTSVLKAIFPVNFFISYEHENDIDWFDTVGYEGEVTGASDDPLIISDTVSASDT